MHRRSIPVIGAVRRVLAGLAVASSLAQVVACGASRDRGPVEVATTAKRSSKAPPVDVGDCAAEPAGDAPRALDRTGVGGAVALADWGDRTVAFVADEGEAQLVVVDVDAARVLGTHDLEGAPSAVAVSDGGRIYVTLVDRASVVVVLGGADASAPMVTACRRKTVLEPRGLAIGPGSAPLVVVGAAEAELALLDPSTLEERGRLDLPREPRAVALVDDGRKAVVSHAVGSVASVIDVRDLDVDSVPLLSRHDHELRELAKKVDEEVGDDEGEGVQAKVREILAEFETTIEDESRRYGGRRRAVQGYAVAATTKPAGRVLLPQVLVDSGGPDRRTDGYGEPHGVTEVPSVAVIDASLGVAMQSSLRLDHRMTYRNDDQPERCLLPRAAAIDDESGTLLVACLGSDTVVAYDALAPEPARAERRRWRVAAGPIGVAVDRFDRRAVVWSKFDRVLSVLSLGEGMAASGGDARSIRRVEVGRGDRRSLELVLGESLFHATNDARIARDGRACASCHPDGRDDGLVWSTPDGARRTPILAGRLEGTAPYGWDGSDRDFDAHVNEALRRLGGVGGLWSLEQRAILRYLESLSPVTVAAKETPKTRRGQQIFASQQAGCAGCHVGPRHQDGALHDVGSATRADRAPRFDTPSLRFVGRGGPYFHDGRYPTLAALLSDEARKMGHTRHLSAADREALVAYLETL